MNVAVAGLWHLGCVTAACLAKAGYHVLGYDAEAKTIAQLKKGISPIQEPGLDALIQEGLASQGLVFSSEASEIANSEVVWICYDTPVDNHDQADTAFVFEQVESLFDWFCPGALIILSSQLPVGSTRLLEQQFETWYPGKPISFACMPENLRLGKALKIFMHPDRVVVGVRTPETLKRIISLLAPLTDRIISMSVESAEMTKHAINAFLATSVVFINELAILCEQVGADAREVEQGLKSESRIGPKAYLRAGTAFSGGTLARDIAFLSKQGADFHLPLHLFEAVQRSNETHKDWIRSKTKETLGVLRNKKIAVWGLTYKPGTDTLRRSLAIELCRWLCTQGATVMAFDPAVKNLPDDLVPLIRLEASALEAAQGSDAIIVATEWKDFLEIPSADLKKVADQPVLIDPGRFLEATLGLDPQVEYYSIGKGPRP
jgi:UDPglucose 6-dehydrogenase